RSISRTTPARATSSALSRSRGIAKVREKSQPVPRGTTASSTPLASVSPLTTSFTEPSPPTTTRKVAPPATASRASSARCPGRSERSASPESPSDVARWAISGQRRPVDPPAEAGLTRKTVGSLMAVAGRGGVERDPRHAVDGRAEVLVGDPYELALDHDVAHGQEAPGLHSPQRSDREQHRGLHLDREDPAPRPAAVLAVIRVVEEVARHDRADAELQVARLRDVDGLVDELPARRRAMRLAGDQMRGCRVGGHGG